MSGSIPANRPVAGRPALPVKHKTLLTIAVMGASIIQILDSTIANVAIPHMQSSLGATFDTITWVLTSYIIAGAVTMPMTGWLSDRIGSRNLFLGAVTLFIVASMLCGIATSLEEMVAFRILQGMGAAFIGPLSQTVMLDINPPERAAKAMSIWGMGIMIAPIMGPVIGGWLTDNYNWRWCFYINLPIGIPTLAVLWWLLPSRQVTRRSFDLFGYSMLAIGLASFQLMLDRGQTEDWWDSWEVIIEGGVAIAALWMFVIQMATAKRPMFERRMFADRNFVSGLGFSLAVGMMMFGIFALLPPLMQNIYGYTVVDTGVLLATRGIGILSAMIIVSRIIERVDARWLIAFGFAITVASLWMMTGWGLAVDERTIVIVGLIQGFGMGMTFMPTNIVAFGRMDPRHRTDGASLLYLMRSLGGSIGISLTTTMLSRGMQASHEALAAHVTSSSMATIDPATADRWGAAGDAALRVADAEVTRQAAMIAYINDFWMMLGIVALFLPLVLLLKRPRPMPGALPPVSE